MIEAMADAVATCALDEPTVRAMTSAQERARTHDSAASSVACSRPSASASVSPGVALLDEEGGRVSTVSEQAATRMGTRT